MNINYKIRKVLKYLDINRHSGTTTLIKEIDEKNDIFVVVPTKEESEAFKNGICFADIIHGLSLQGLPKKPILMANHTLMALLSDCISKMEWDEGTIYAYKKALSEIKVGIEEFELENNISLSDSESHRKYSAFL